jgi:hypothetical protein
MERGQAIAAAVTSLIGALTLYFNNHHYTAALVGALSVGFVLFAISKRPALMHVEFSTTIIALLDNVPTPCIQVVVENHSGADLTFNRGCAAIQWHRSGTRFTLWVLLNEVIWPHRLPSGASLILMTTIASLKESLRAQNIYLNTELRAVVMDAIGRQGASKPTKIPPDEYFEQILRLGKT